MKIKLLAAVLIWLFVFENNVFAQKENYVWYFGDSAGVDFNSGSPVALTDGVLYTGEGCSSISDVNGNLLFYTDGVTVWDRNHNQMSNGDSLAGGSSSSQSALIVPFPGNNLLFYIFTVGQFESPPIDFDYSIVDMSLNGGNGDVTIKNNIIKTPVTEKLTAVKHSNGSDIWVIVHGYDNDSLFNYLITGSGIATTPVVTKVGQVISSYDAIGYMKFSPDGSKLAYAAYGNNYVGLFDFNSTTGAVTNEKYLTLPPTSFGLGANGLEFSTSGNYLYCSEVSPGLFQWDITSNSAIIINSTLQQLDSTSGQLGALQLGPDGKIYVGKSSTNFLGVINYADSSGALCNYVDNAVSLSGKTCLYGLPNFISSYFLSTGISQFESPISNLQIFPNPTTNELNISGLPFNVGDKISILEPLGKTIFTKTFSAPAANYKLSTAGLSNGIYFLSVETTSHGERSRTMVKKVVVQH